MAAQGSAFDVQILTGAALAAWESGAELPADIAGLMRTHMGTLVQTSPRGVAAERLALLALQDGHPDRAERWVRTALKAGAGDIVEGDALLTLARIRLAQGRSDEAREILARARLIHPPCPRWATVDAAVG